MMVRLTVLLAALCSLAGQARGQYANDNIAFRTLPLRDLDSVLRATPNALLLDVRSAAEFADTSRNAWLNLGRLQGAINVPVDSVPARMAELRKHRNDPILIYCSHSRRSRVVSKQLADSGFTAVTNVNGGISSYWREQGPRLAGLSRRIVRGKPYAILNPTELCAMLERAKDPGIVLDVRSDTAFGALDGDERMRALGGFHGATHIPLADLERRANELSKNAPIAIVDDWGGDAPRAADRLNALGFTDLSVLFEGLEGWIETDAAQVPCRERVWRSEARYHVLAASSLVPGDLEHRFARIIDVRSDEEYENRYEQTWRNIGRLKGALHITPDRLKDGIAELGADRTAAILLYDFGSSAAGYSMAEALSDTGFTNVWLLSGLYDLRWCAANMPGMSFLNASMENVPH